MGEGLCAHRLHRLCSFCNCASLHRLKDWKASCRQGLDDGYWSSFQAHFRCFRGALCRRDFLTRLPPRQFPPTDIHRTRNSSEGRLTAYVDLRLPLSNQYNSNTSSSTFLRRSVPAQLLLTPQLLREIVLEAIYAYLTRLSSFRHFLPLHLTWSSWLQMVVDRSRRSRLCCRRWQLCAMGNGSRKRRHMSSWRASRNR